MRRQCMLIAYRQDLNTVCQFPSLNLTKQTRTRTTHNRAPHEGAPGSTHMSAGLLVRHLFLKDVFVLYRWVRRRTGVASVLGTVGIHCVPKIFDRIIVQWPGIMFMGLTTVRTGRHDPDKGIAALLEMGRGVLGCV